MAVAVPKPCAGCGTDLAEALGRNIGQAKYCSAQCRPLCPVEDCTRPTRGEYCGMHDQQARRGGPFKPSAWSDRTTCVVCDAPTEWGSGRRKHCSIACQQTDSRTRKLGGRPDAFTCRLCGKTVNIRSRKGGRLQRTDRQWCRDCGRASPEAMRFKVYGITPDEYATASARGCGICGAKDQKLHVDHDHTCCGPRKVTCGKCVRGLICGPCNRALGLLADDPSVIRSAARYLDLWTDRKEAHPCPWS